RSAGFALAGLAAQDADGVRDTGTTATVGAAGGFAGFLQGCAFAGRQEEIGLDGVLFGVEVVVAAALRIEAFVRAALDDAAGLHDEDLLGAADGGEADRKSTRLNSSHQIISYA